MCRSDPRRGPLINLMKEAITSDHVVVNGMIVVEVLSGISKQSEFKKVESAFKGFHFVTVSEEDYYSASLLGSSLRRNGISVPSTDLIIAASAIKGDHTLLHLDHHFDLIAKHSSLKSINLL